MTDTNQKTSHKRPTLKTIADITGLAVTTVSRALSGAPEIAAETRKRVAATAEQIGYVPDRAAQRLRTGRTNVVSMILAPHDELLGFSTSITMGISRALSDTNFNLLVTPSFKEDSELETIKKIVRHKVADGVIFSRTEPFDPRIRFLQEAEFPFVCHGRSEFSQPHLYVDYDNQSFAQIAVERLVSKGRKRLLAIMPDRKFTFYAHLKYGFSTAATDAGVHFDVPDEVSINSDASDIYRVIAARLTGPNPPDGFICAGEALAMNVMACLTDHGKSLGQDADIVAKQSSRLFNHVRPKVDTIYEDIAATGFQMGKMLLGEIASPAVDKQGIILLPEPNFV